MRRTIGTAALVGAAVLALVGIGTTGAGARAPSDEPSTVRIVNLNLLHGVFCPPETKGCQAPDRVDLLMQQLEAAECPEVVGLQEINANLAKIIAKVGPKSCGYEIVYPGIPGSLDTEQVLTTLPIKSKKVVKLVGNFRTASRVVLTSRLGPLVVVTTHQDGDPEGRVAGPPCKRCPPPCVDAQVDIFACQTVVAARLAETAGGDDAVRVLMGDFNVPPTSGRYALLVGDGWIDSYLAAGNPECDGATGVGCTGGRDDKTIEALKDPNAREVERIDYVFVQPSPDCDVAFDSPDDANGNGLGTTLFGAVPAVDGPGGLVWTSDHTGVSADISCGD
jgi:endonuclease/exonuclease/phosphatase family metal-dependent hydrolase